MTNPHAYFPINPNNNTNSLDANFYYSYLPTFNTPNVSSVRDNKSAELLPVQLISVDKLPSPEISIEQMNNSVHLAPFYYWLPSSNASNNLVYHTMPNTTVLMKNLPLKWSSILNWIINKYFRSFSSIFFHFIFILFYKLKHKAHHKLKIINYFESD